MAETPEDTEVRLPPALRWLQALVITLTLSLIGGVITVVWLLVTRLPVPGAYPGAHPTLPPALQMPAGATAAAVTMGSGWVAVVTTDNRILIFGADGKFWQEVAVKAPSP
jgi:Flp pilus assembly protein protease CpaA